MKLDMHCEMILDEYRDRLPVLNKMKEVVLDILRRTLKENNMVVTAIEGRVKTEKSLTGKLELKGNKYHTIDDITDIVGLDQFINFLADIGLVDDELDLTVLVEDMHEAHLAHPSLGHDPAGDRDFVFVVFQIFLAVAAVVFFDQF